jgi:hypothetical protein
MRTENLGGVAIEFPEWCRVTVQRQLDTGTIAEFTAEERWIENYATAGRDSAAPNAMWRKRPRGQLRKCAEAQALRMAFPELVGAAPTAEEMEGREIDATAGEAPPPAQAQLAARETYPEDRFAAQLTQWAELVTSGRKTVNEILSAIGSRYELTNEQRHAIEDLAQAGESEHASPGIGEEE